MNKNKNLLLWFFLSYLLFSSQDVQAMRIDRCTAQVGRTCEADCVAAGKIPNPGDPVCARWLLPDQQCCVPNATGPGSGAPGFPTGLNYQLLEKIPGTDNLSGSDLPGYVSALYKVALVIVTLSAVLMLSIGGFMYLTSAGNVSAISTAKGIIYDSLIGLVIALFAWLVLYIINPDLVEITLNGLPAVATTPAPTGTVPVPGPGGAPTGPTSGSYTNAQAVAALSAAGISVTSSGSCSDINNPRCTSLDGIPQSTITNVIRLKSACGCSFNVTGGTEVGHASHGSGKPIVDISESASLNSYLQKQKVTGALSGTDNITKICASRTYLTTAYNCGSFVEAAPHFHVQFKP